ncbi:unnamed protein product [Prorocentrum cordatum]|uniref:Uncharacterized protein n=1 Tax=Prorocentrum cordatum TaxID=2364126 RepID=A0ABN9PPL3_9DINO|nr:unnamed protein product [Polarella glacialis]
MTIKCAYRRNCRFLDNDNYQDWLRALHNPRQRAWLESNQEKLHMKYYFDSLGFFETLDGNRAVISIMQGASDAGGRTGPCSLGSADYTRARVDPVSHVHDDDSTVLCAVGSASSPAVTGPPRLPHVLPQHSSNAPADESSCKPMHQAKQRLVAYRRLVPDLTPNKSHSNAVLKWCKDVVVGKEVAGDELASASLNMEPHVLQDLRVILAEAGDHDSGISWVSLWLKWGEPFTDSRSVAPGKNAQKRAENTLWYFGRAPPSLLS